MALPPSPLAWPSQLLGGRRLLQARAAFAQPQPDPTAAAWRARQSQPWRFPDRQQQQRKRPPAVVYLPNFLHPDDAVTVLAESRKLRPKLRPELNTVAVGRLGCYLPPDSPSVAILSSGEVAKALTERLRAPGRLSASDFPMELRAYERGAHMPWHRDEQLFDLPQWECIYTIDNTSDSVTQWRDDAGELHERGTDPNSLLAVLAEAWDHRVTPVGSGSRTIIKFAVAASHTQLPAFRANLERQAYAE